MLVLTNQRPGKGYAVGMLLVAFLALALSIFMLFFGVVSLVKAWLLILCIGSIVFFYAIPALAKRSDYIGSEPVRQPAKINICPYIVFVGICLAGAAWGWFNPI